MSLTIACTDMGASEAHSITGNSTDEIIRQMQEHAIATHGYTEMQVQQPDIIEFMRGAIRQSARPVNLRSPREV